MLVLVVGSPLLTLGSHSGQLIEKTAIFFARVVHRETCANYGLEANHGGLLDKISTLQFVAAPRP